MRRTGTQAEAAARAAVLEVESYDLSLDFVADPAQVRSRVEIAFWAFGRVPVVTFADVSTLAVEGVVFNGRALDPEEVVSDGRLRLDGLQPRNVLTVEAVAGYSSSGRGLSQWKDPADGAEYVLAYSYPTHAPDIFGCFDQPDLRADLRLTVRAPAGWVCISNGAVTDRPPPGESGNWRFATVAQMKPFELTLCAGPYVSSTVEETAEGAMEGHAGPSSARQVVVRAASRAVLAGSTGLSRAVQMVDRSIAYYGELLGVPCPCAEVDVVLVPGLAAVATMVPGLMLVNESFLDRLADPDDGFGPVVMAHEAAHLWFGCVVEGRWWDDLWLAEAMATYLSYRAVEVLGTEAAWAEFALREQAAAYAADGVPGAQSVASAVGSAHEALSRPFAITYAKGAAVLRQLAASIGDDAFVAGLRDCLIRYAGKTASLDEVIACWSVASGRDLRSWAEDWLRTPGVDTLRSELIVAPDGTIASFAILQDPGPVRRRTHRLDIGLYDRHRGPLQRRNRLEVDVAGPRTVVAGLTGMTPPDALVLNDADLTFASVRLDPASLDVLMAEAVELADPVAAAVVWNALWDMTGAGELGVPDFVALVARVLRRGRMVVGMAELIGHAVAAADHLALPERRPDLRRIVAGAALDGARMAPPGSRVGAVSVHGFAAAAQTPEQLTLLRSWLDGVGPPGGVGLGTALRRQIFATLSAADRVTDADLDRLAATDPVTGVADRVTCVARRPDPVAKEAAWRAALAEGLALQLARAHAEGIWVAGQEDLLRPYRARYFAEALPALAGREPRTVQRLAGLLYPAILVDEVTLGATDGALGDARLDPVLRAAVSEKREILARALAVRTGQHPPGAG